MICVSITHPTPERCTALLQTPGLQMAELRLEEVELSSQELNTLFSFPVPLIATCRPTTKRQETDRQHILLNAIHAGAAYVDIEMETECMLPLIETAREKNCRVIISYHNFQNTPSSGTLQEILLNCLAKGADIVKIACLTYTPADCARLLALYGCEMLHDKESPYYARQVLAIGMGEVGKITRIAAPFLGAPFTFAAAETGQETAPGQLNRLTLETLYHLLK